jgi:hypothetical protein
MIPLKVAFKAAFLFIGTKSLVIIQITNCIIIPVSLANGQVSSIVLRVPYRNSHRQESTGIMWNKYTNLSYLEVVKWRFRLILYLQVEL